MSPRDSTMDMDNPWLSRAAFLPFMVIGMLVVFNGGLVSGIFQTEEYILISYFGLGIMMTAMIAHTVTKAICWQMQQTRQQPTADPKPLWHVVVTDTSRQTAPNHDYRVRPSRQPP